ncbi:hypothetical protein HAX54_017689 [Datura stramonium]|uniref:Uncharacterized protein n=1 Tax=Datura stramonium TaxID=4076 RepID=A0ABS8UN72_DATST|nr:hypothetical protein [Datura stramonium]
MVRIQFLENLRVPPQGSFTEGESWPKIRPKGVVDGQQVNIHVLPLVDLEGRRRLGCRKMVIGSRTLGGRQRRPPSWRARAISEIPLWKRKNSNLVSGPTGQGTVSGRQFLSGVGLPKGNGGTQMFPRARRRLALECKGKRELDYKTHSSSRDESRP